MPTTPETIDLPDWHRYFAVEANNRAWDLAVATRNPEQDREMLNAAHAAALHWRQIGTELHNMRAIMLLAEVHALLGLSATALAYADEMRTYFLNNKPPDWELAFVYAIHAHAAFVAGEADTHRQSYLAAEQAIAAIADDEDRAIVLQTFEQVVAP